MSVLAIISLLSVCEDVDALDAMLNLPLTSSTCPAQKEENASGGECHR
jgi:hypothetical protein